MAYPYQANATAQEGPNVIYGPDKNVYYKNCIFQALNGGTNPNIYLAVTKSTDAGVTWAEEDSASHPDQTNSGNYKATAQYWDGAGGLWFAYAEDNGASAPTQSIVQQFAIDNSGNGTWQTPITGAPVAVPTAGGTAPLSDNVYAQIGIVVRSNGEIVLIHSGSVLDPNEGSTHSRNTLQSSVYASGAWGAAQDLLVTSVSETNLVCDYSLLGVVKGDNDLVHVFANCTNEPTHMGYVHIVIKADNSLALYRRCGEDDQGRDMQYSRGLWGAPVLLTFGPYKYAALPVAATVTLQSSVVLKPGLYLFPDSDSLLHYQMMFVDDSITRAGAWRSVSVCQDASTGSVYLYWTHETGSLNSGDFEIRGVCWKGGPGPWTNPSALVSFDWATYDSMEVMEVTAEGGVIRMIASAQHSGGNVWYWQGAVTCSATGGASTGNINSLR
jgi:hypothetical protein